MNRSWLDRILLFFFLQFLMCLRVMWEHICRTTGSWPWSSQMKHFSPSWHAAGQRLSSARQTGGGAYFTIFSRQSCSPFCDWTRRRASSWENEGRRHNFSLCVCVCEKTQQQLPKAAFIPLFLSPSIRSPSFLSANVIISFPFVASLHGSTATIQQTVYESIPSPPPLPKK